jgi:hypothetical protein
MGKERPVSCQSTTGNSPKTENSSKNQSLHTSVRGFDLLQASVPKTFGTIDFFFKLVTARTLSLGVKTEQIISDRPTEGLRKAKTDSVG